MPSVCLSVSLSIFLSFFLSAYLSFYKNLSFYQAIGVSIYLISSVFFVTTLLEILVLCRPTISPFQAPFLFNQLSYNSSLSPLFYPPSPHLFVVTLLLLSFHFSLLCSTAFLLYLPLSPTSLSPRSFFSFRFCFLSLLFICLSLLSFLPMVTLTMIPFSYC